MDGNIVWSFESCRQDGNASATYESEGPASTGRYVIRLNGEEIWAAPPRTETAPTDVVAGWRNLFLQTNSGQINVWLGGYSNNRNWKSEGRGGLCPDGSTPPAST